jgi:choline dehydrogenase-like flavoprotein
MIIDARQLAEGSCLNGEVCIIGAGIAGIITALELGRQGHQVLLMEAGGWKPDSVQRTAQRGDVSESEHEPLEDVSVRRLGGALALWGGRLLPLDEGDFQPHAARPESWPIAKKDLSPYYPRANEALGGGSYEYFAAAALPNAEPLLLGKTSANVDETKLWRWGPPIRYRHFAKALQESLNVRLVHHCVAKEIVPGGDGEIAAFIRAAADPSKNLRLCARTFVMAGGGLEVARLLLASRSVHKDGLGNEFGQIGAGYLTHPVGEVGLLTVSPPLARRLCSFEWTRDLVYSRRFISFSEAARAERGLPNINITFWSPDAHDPAHGDGVLSAYALTKRFLITRGLTDKVAGAHRSNLGRAPMTGRHLRNIILTAPATVSALGTWGIKRWLSGRQIPALIRSGSSGMVRLRIDAEQRRDPNNFVRLSDELDEFGVPRLKVFYRVNERDRRAYYESLKLLQEEIGRSAKGSLELPSLASFMNLRLGDGTHQMGLTRMSSTPQEGAVDSQCRLYSCKNVYIASTSVFPTAGAAPPTLTLVALSLRLADHLDKVMAQPALELSP